MLFRSDSEARSPDLKRSDEPFIEPAGVSVVVTSDELFEIFEVVNLEQFV